MTGNDERSATPEIDPAVWEAVERQPFDGFVRVTWLRRERFGP